MSKLTAKQAAFCNEYMIDLNATQAALRAGYSANSAQEISSQNLSKLIVQTRIAELMHKRATETATDARWVLARARERYDACIANDDDKTAHKYLETIAKHVNVRAFDTTVKTDLTLTINSINYSGSSGDKQLANQSKSTDILTLITQSNEQTDQNEDL